MLPKKLGVLENSSGMFSRPLKNKFSSVKKLMLPKKII
jgi:hypothetical protein